MLHDLYRLACGVHKTKQVGIRHASAREFNIFKDSLYSVLFSVTIENLAKLKAMGPMELDENHSCPTKLTFYLELFVIIVVYFKIK